MARAPRGTLVFLALVLFAASCSAKKAVPPRAATVPSMDPDLFHGITKYTGLDDVPDYAIVDFFQPRCPHCRRFAPQFAAASNAFSYDENVQFYKVDCDKWGEDICNSIDEIDGFPTVIMYSHKIENGTAMFSGETTTEKVVKWVLDHMAEEDAPRSSTDAEEEAAEKIEEIGEETEPPTKVAEPGVPPRRGVAEVAESTEPTPPKGGEAPVETSPEPAVDAEESNEDFGGDANDVLQTRLDNLAEIDGQLKNTMGDLGTSYQQMLPRPEWGTGRPMMQDLKSTVQLMFARDVFNKKALRRAEARTAFVNFVAVLAEAFPMEVCRKSFVELQTKIKETRKEELITADHVDIGESWRLCNEEWRQPEFRSCAGTTPETRGQTCGMWVTFHTLIAHMADSSALSGVAAIRDFILNFFSCRECREHFREMSKDLDTQVSTQYDAMMWFWNAHNMVNDRLEGDPLNDPNFPKVQFPPEYMCPACWKQGENGLEWDEAEVYDFLQRHYCRDFYNPKCAKYSKDPIYGVNRGIAHYKYNRGDRTDFEKKDKAIILLVGIAACAVVTIAVLIIKLRTTTPHQPAMSDLYR